MDISARITGVKYVFKFGKEIFISNYLTDSDYEIQHDLFSIQLKTWQWS